MDDRRHTSSPPTRCTEARDWAQGQGWMGTERRRRAQREREWAGAWTLYPLTREQQTWIWLNQAVQPRPTLLVYWVAAVLVVDPRHFPHLPEWLPDNIRYVIASVCHPVAAGLAGH